jgi:hypothetical protein
MAARLHILGGGDDLFVDESASDAAQLLWGDENPYAELHEGEGERTVLVNPAAVAYVTESGTPEVHNLADYT